MGYVLTVRAVGGRLLHDREAFESIDTALALVAERYLADPHHPARWIGYFLMQDGALARLRISRSTAGMHLRGDIDTIDIMSSAIACEPAGPPLGVH
jgi:hypothetical protein